MVVEANQFQEEYILAMKLIGDKAYCWKKEELHEIGRRIEIPGQRGLGYDVWGTGPSWEAAFAQVKERHERENKPAKRVRSKKMNTIKVKDPKHDGYVIYVHPRQGFLLELSIPSNATEDDDWQVEIFSEYFAPACTGFKDGCKIYEFTQLFDLSSWAKVSSVQIAEVLIRWKGLKRDGYTSRKVFVILQGHKSEQRDVLTIVNPVCTKVRVGPHQLLEVVVFDNDAIERNYADQIDFCIEQDKPYLEIERIATRKVTHVLENGQYRDLNEDPYLINRHTFSVPANPKIADGSPIAPVRRAPGCVYRATHFYYRMSRHCIRDVQRMANGSYKASEVVIYDDEHKINSDYALDVWIGIKGAFKPKLLAYGLSKRQQLLVKENALADGSSIGKKVLAKEHLHEKGMLLNPDDHDNIEFKSGDDNCLTIEIAPPHSFNPKCPVALTWDVTADPIWQYRHRHEPQTRLTVVTLDKRVVLGVSIQRFMVSPAKGHEVTAGKHTILGILKFAVDGFKYMTRCVSFYMVAGDKPAKHTTRHSTYTPSLPPVPMRVIVKFQEFRTDDLMVAGARSEKFSEIKIEDAVTNSKGKKKKAEEEFGVKVSER